jgi:hypothetical protein
MSLIRWAPVGLAAIAEAAWIAVVAGFAQEVVLRLPVVTVADFVVAVVVGVAGARVVGLRLGVRWPPLALGLAIGAGLGGVLLDPTAREALVSGDGPSAALAANPGGLLLGVAVLRGYGHAHVPLSEDRLGRLLFGGTVAISLLGLVGGLVTDPYRSRFETDAMTATLLFAGSAVLALALTRLTVVGAGSGADWTKNPIWVGLLVAIVALAELVAAPAVGLVRPAIELTFGVIVGPLLVIGMLLGWSRGSVQAVLVVLVIGAFVLVLLPFIGSSASTTTAPGGLGTGPSTAPPPPDPGVASIGLALLAIVGVVVTLLLIRAWMRGAVVDADDAWETRSIDRGDETVHVRRRRRRLFRPVPRDAAAAYRMLVDELAGRPVVAREAGETPREHARRLRGDGWGRLGLELLAADYALDRFAGERLTPVEDRRAIGRWRRLRGELRPYVPPPIEEADPRRRRRGMGRFDDAEDLASGLRARDELDR